MTWEEYLTECANMVVDLMYDAVDSVAEFKEDVINITEQIDVLEKGD